MYMRVVCTIITTETKIEIGGDDGCLIISMVELSLEIWFSA